MAVTVAPILTHIGTEGGREGDLLAYTIYLELILENCELVWSTEEDALEERAKAAAPSRVSVAFTQRLCTRDPALLTLSIASAHSLDSAQSPLVAVVEEEERSSPSADQPKSEEDLGEEGPARLPSLESLPLEFPVIRLVPQNGQFPQVELQLHLALKFCRVLKGGNLKKGLEQFQTLAFDSKCISREHAEVWWAADQGSVILKDLNSTCGTRLNGKRLPPGAPVALKSGDTVVLGDNVPEQDDGSGKNFQDHEVPPSHRCVRMVMEMVAMPQTPPTKSSSPGSAGAEQKKSRRRTTVDVMTAALTQVADQVQQQQPLEKNRKALSVTLRMSPRKKGSLERIELFEDDRQPYTVNIADWKSRG